MREIEGENGNEHLMENSCTLLYDYIEWTRMLVVFLDCGCNFVVHPCLSPESWLVLSVHISEAKQEHSRECCKPSPYTGAVALQWFWSMGGDDK